MCLHFNTKRYACNYNCSICKKSGKIPNILGKFVIVDNNVICTGCKNTFTKEECEQYLQ